MVPISQYQSARCCSATMTFSELCSFLCIRSIYFTFVFVFGWSDSTTILTWLTLIMYAKLNSCKGGELRDTKTLNLSSNIVSLQVFVDVSRFSPCVINLSRNKNICCRLKKVVAKSRARVYFEQQILALLLVFHQTHNLSLNKFARALANQPISAPHFFNPQQMFLLRVKLIKQGEKRETSNLVPRVSHLTAP